MAPLDDVLNLIRTSLPSLAASIDRNNAVPGEFLDELARAGAFKALSLGLRGVYQAVREASKWSPAVAHIIMTSASVAFRVGSDGEIFALCITEPGGGTDIRANLKTRAEDRAGGEAYIAGEKVFASNSLYASSFLVLANGSAGPTLYMVKRGPGVRVEPQDLFTFRGAGVGRVVFENAPATVVGTPGRGIREALETVNFERLSYGFIGLGIKDGALEEAGPRALRKVIFGKELGEYQGIRWALADIEVASRLLEEFLNAAVARAESAGRVDPYDAAIAKVSGAQLAQRATWLAIQIMGGSGFASGSRLERLARDARMLDIGAGAREVIYDFIGEMAVKKYRGP